MMNTKICEQNDHNLLLIANKRHVILRPQFALFRVMCCNDTTTKLQRIIFLVAQICQQNYSTLIGLEDSNYNSNNSQFAFSKSSSIAFEKNHGKKKQFKVDRPQTTITITITITDELDFQGHRVPNNVPELPRSVKPQLVEETTNSGQNLPHAFSVWSK